MAIVDHGNPGAWHGTSMTVPATTVACANDAEVLDGMGALDSHEFRAAEGRSRPRQARTASPVQATQTHNTTRAQCGGQSPQ
ncbi:hypothetical protein EDB84DRAFT_1459772 [Lactarius hengduanensis]|nr:hypothetical protein EDB84DRAFT_1459772 [Lactarius hengduanensis]